MSDGPDSPPAPSPLPGPASSPPPPPPSPPPLPGAPPAAAPTPLGDGPGPAERAAFQVTEQTRTYPCRQCGDSLVFDIARQKLVCPSCGSSVDIDLTDLPAPTERDLRATMGQLRALMDSGRVPAAPGEKEIVCQSCGGHTTFSGTLTAIRCPYCATPIQRDDIQDAPARLAVDGVVPFAVDEKTARGQLEQWINGRRFAPTEFKKYQETGAFSSIYAAYFTYDSETTTRYRGRRGDDYTVTVGSGQNQRTETRTNWSPAAGIVRDHFDDLTVLANDGFDPKRVKALEPWPTHAAEPFSPQFVAGHLCRTYDHDAGEAFGEAQRAMEAGIEATIRSDIGGDRQQITERQIGWDVLTFKHLLLPIWLLTVIYQGRPFQVFINGVTGEVQGQRPWSRVKIAAAVAAAVVLLVVVIVLWSMARSSGGGGA